MNQKKLNIILSCLLAIFIWFIWPSSVEFHESDGKTVINHQANTKRKERQPQRNADPIFLAKEVKLAESTQASRKSFKVTNPDAIAYNKNEHLALVEGAGKTPLITSKQINESPQLQSVIEATDDPQNLGNRLSPLVKAQAFDKKLYKTDDQYRKTYLASAEPGRVYLSDSKSKFKLKRLSPYYQEVQQGDSVFISVQAEPHMPVSITSFDLGAFSNHLTFQTVEADASGVASFEFLGVEGTFNDSNLLVSSPTSAGQAKFVIHTKIKKTAKINQ